MSDEKQSQEAENVNDNHSSEEALPLKEKGLNEEIADLAAEAEVTELPSVEAVEAEIVQEEQKEDAAAEEVGTEEEEKETEAPVAQRL